jgi:protein phosphatase
MPQQSYCTTPTTLSIPISPKTPHQSTAAGAVQSAARFCPATGNRLSSQQHPIRSIDIGSATNAGRGEHSHEGSCLAESIELTDGRASYLLAITDGMGEPEHAAYASQAALLTVRQTIAASLRCSIPRTGEDWLALLVGACQDASYRLFAENQRRRTRPAMGTTLTVGLVIDSALYLAHIGHSRMYLIDAFGITQLTVDHTVAQRLIATGRYQPHDPALSKYDQLYQKIGDSSIRIQSRQIRLAAGDQLVLCSAELTKHFPNHDILSIAHTHNNTSAVCEALVHRVADRGGCDSVSVIALFCKAYHGGQHS